MTLLHSDISLAELCPSKLSYVESRLVSNELGHTAEEIFKQIAEGRNWFFLAR